MNPYNRIKEEGFKLGHYSIYWIKDEVAYQYFHKSGILYRLFQEYQTCSKDTDLQKQYNFITNAFPVASFTTHLKNQLDGRYNLTARGNQIEIFDEPFHITLHIYEKQINFRCETLHDAEALLFPALRAFHPFLFIIRNDCQNYGWITPVLNESAHLHGQVLYS